MSSSQPSNPLLIPLCLLRALRNAIRGLIPLRGYTARHALGGVVVGALEVLLARVVLGARDVGPDGLAALGHGVAVSAVRRRRVGRARRAHLPRPRRGRVELVVAAEVAGLALELVLRAADAFEVLAACLSGTILVAATRKKDLMYKLKQRTGHGHLRRHPPRAGSSCCSWRWWIGPGRIAPRHRGISVLPSSRRRLRHWETSSLRRSSHRSC